MPAKPAGKKLSACREMLDKAGLTRDLTPDEALALAKLGENAATPNAVSSSAKTPGRATST